MGGYIFRGYLFLFEEAVYIMSEYPYKRMVGKERFGV
jgi:hypothetical protein